MSRADRETILSLENSTENVIDSERTQNISIYVGLVAGCIILSLTRALLFFHILINSSHHLHNRMFAAILRAPIYFFDSNPVGKFHIAEMIFPYTSLDVMFESLKIQSEE